MKATIENSDLATFTTVVTEGSFTAAANRLDTNKAHVSRVVSRLEARLGAQLLNRSTRQISLTEVGREFFERASSILAAVEAAELAVSRLQGAPTGTLKLSAGAEFGQLRVNSWVTDYLARYPEVSVAADYSNRIADIIHEGIDVAIRVGDLPDSELSARRLGDIDYGLYAHPNYLMAAGRLETPADLASHPLIHFSPAGHKRWELTDGQVTRHLEVEPRLSVNNNLAVRHAVAEGLGIALLPTFQAEQLTDLQPLTRVLPDWSRPPVPVHAVFASGRYMSPKVRAFIDVCVDLF